MNKCWIQCSSVLGRIILSTSARSHAKGDLLPITTGLYFVPCNPTHYFPVASGWEISILSRGTQTIGCPKSMYWGPSDELVQTISFLGIKNKGIGLERLAVPSDSQNYEGSDALSEHTYEAQLSHFYNRILEWWTIVSAAEFLEQEAESLCHLGLCKAPPYCSSRS